MVKVWLFMVKRQVLFLLTEAKARSEGELMDSH